MLCFRKNWAFLKNNLLYLLDKLFFLKMRIRNKSLSSTKNVSNNVCYTSHGTSRYRNIYMQIFTQIVGKLFPVSV